MKTIKDEDLIVVNGGGREVREGPGMFKQVWVCGCKEVKPPADGPDYVDTSDYDHDDSNDANSDFTP